MMNTKILSSILIVGLATLALLFFWRSDKGTKKNMALPLREGSILLKGDKGQIKINMNNRKVVAKTSKEAEKIASVFYNKMLSHAIAPTNQGDEKLISDAEMQNSIYSTFGLENGVFNEVHSGEAIEVNSFYNNEPLSQFVSLYSHNKIVAISIFRDYHKNGEKELGSVTEMKKGWDSYPPITPYEAETQLIKNYPKLSYMTIPGYYYIEDGETPYYLYEGNDGHTTQYYLVNAYYKEIVVKENRDSPYTPPPPVKRNKEGFIETDASLPPVRRNKEGLIEMDNSFVGNLSEEEQAQLRSHLEMTNKYIKEGIVKFDEDMNVVYDKRPDKDKNVSISDKGKQDSDNHDTSNDHKINIPSEPALIIR